MKNQKSFSARRIVVAGMLAAMIVMLDVTGIGMLNIGLGAAITLFSLPVLVGVMAEGLSVGLLMGGAFGVISFVRAFSSPEPLAPLFMNPLVSIVPRLLIPVVAWLVLKALHPLYSAGGKKRALARAVAALAGSLTNTVLVLSMAFLMVALGTAIAGMSTAVVGGILLSLIVTNGLPEAVCMMLVVPPILSALDRSVYKANSQPRSAHDTNDGYRQHKHKNRTV